MEDLFEKPVWKQVIIFSPICPSNTKKGLIHPKLKNYVYALSFCPKPLWFSSVELNRRYFENVSELFCP